jgi:hypothetical protein
MSMKGKSKPGLEGIIAKDRTGGAIIIENLQGRSTH